MISMIYPVGLTRCKAKSFEITASPFRIPAAACAGKILVQISPCGSCTTRHKCFVIVMNIDVAGYTNGKIDSGVVAAQNGIKMTEVTHKPRSRHSSSTVFDEVFPGLLDDIRNIHALVFERLLPKQFMPTII